MQTSTIFDSFNARSLEPWQVAATFVPSQHYDTLAARRHSLVVGPRGSGKTTLLKMLQQRALEAWQHPKADTYRSRIDHTGVFVPTDRNWGAQLDSLGYGRLDAETHKVFSVAAFTTHVLRSLISAMLNRVGRDVPVTSSPHRRVSMSIDQEVTMARSIAKAWHLDVPVASLSAVKHALTSRLSEIRTIANIEAFRDSTARHERLNEPWLHLHFIQAAGVAVEIFDDCCGATGKWALLFDELELAPEWIRTELLRSLRSTDDRFLFKLSISPVSSDMEVLSHPFSPQTGQDYDEIVLWYSEKDDNVSFSTDLWASMLRARGLPDLSPRAVLGRSIFETPREEWSDAGTAYAPDSRAVRRLKRVSQTDNSLASFLARKGINLEAVGDVTRGERAKLLRKIAPLVALREEFRKPDSRQVPQPTRRTRSRKGVKVYTGAAALFAVLEGNPRWFIAVTSRLLDSYVSNAVSRVVQATEIDDAANRFRAMLRTLPVERVVRSYRSRGLLSILDRIGKYFFQRTVIDSFDPDPPGTFTVDSNVSAELIDALGVALNAGAVVLVASAETGGATHNLAGKRFRLSYLLAPSYGIPLRLGRPVSLGLILREHPAQANLPIELSE